MSTSPSTSKKRRSSKWLEIAKEQWPHAYRIEIYSDGPYALVTACRPGHIIVSLHADGDKAEEWFHYVDKHGCGGRCRGRDSEWHEVFDLSCDVPIQWPPKDHGNPPLY